MSGAAWSAGAVDAVGPIPRSVRAAPRRLRRLRSDVALAERFAAGDESAFTGLFERHRASVHAVCMGVLGSRDDAEDATQEAFAALSVALRQCPPRELRPWLLRVARNAAIDVARRRSLKLVSDQPLDESTVAAGAAGGDSAELESVLSGIRQLPEAQRTALLMRELAGHSYEEIAALLEVNQDSVRGLIARARIGLREYRAASELPCSSVRAVLADEPDGRRRDKTVRRHLRGCIDCRAFRQGLQSDARVLRALDPGPAGGVAGGGALVGLAAKGALAGGAMSQLGVAACTVSVCSVGGLVLLVPHPAALHGHHVPTLHHARAAGATGARGRGAPSRTAAGAATPALRAALGPDGLGPIAARWDRVTFGPRAVGLALSGPGFGGDRRPVTEISVGGPDGGRASGAAAGWGRTGPVGRGRPSATTGSTGATAGVTGSTPATAGGTTGSTATGWAQAGSGTAPAGWGGAGGSGGGTTGSSGGASGSGGGASGSGGGASGSGGGTTGSTAGGTRAGSAWAGKGSTGTGTGSTAGGGGAGSGSGSAGVGSTMDGTRLTGIVTGADGDGTGSAGRPPAAGTTGSAGTADPSGSSDTAGATGPAGSSDTAGATGSAGSMDTAGATAPTGATAATAPTDPTPTSGTTGTSATTAPTGSTDTTATTDPAGASSSAGAGQTQPGA